MKIALAQINPTVGAVADNCRIIEQIIGQCQSQGVQLVVFPELALVGYPPKDLLLKPVLIEQATEAIDHLASLCTDVAAIIGYPLATHQPDKGRPLHNAAAFCEQGVVRHTYIKSLLPTYDVFDEHRYFEPASTEVRPSYGPDALKHGIAKYMGRHLGVSICEDLWNEPALFERQLYTTNPAEALTKAGADVFINCSASPFVQHKHEFRIKLFEHTTRRFDVPLLYCNQVGGNDELVFDGNSCAFDAQGELIAHAKAFEQDLLVFVLPEKGEASTKTSHKASTVRIPAINHDPVGSVYEALVLGIRDYCRKCGFKQIVLGLSGGIDSAVTAALCVAAVGKENVRGVAMPSRYSSQGSVDDARALAENLDMTFDVIAISQPHEAFENVLADVFSGLEPDVTEENIQARVRGVILMAMSNKFGSLLVTTGNKSELAVGYCTLYGDMAGGLAALSDVPKTLVWDLARWINENQASPLLKRFGKPVIPENSIIKPPSAELRPDQKDEDSLPAYQELDRMIELYVEQDRSVRQIVAETRFEEAQVKRIVRLIDRNEYKRKQAAPGIKVTGRAFGFGRRMPMAQRFDDSKQIIRDA